MQKYTRLHMLTHSCPFSSSFESLRTCHVNCYWRWGLGCPAPAVSLRKGCPWGLQWQLLVQLPLFGEWHWLQRRMCPVWTSFPTHSLQSCSGSRLLEVFISIKCFWSFIVPRGELWCHLHFTWFHFPETIEDRFLHIFLQTFVFLRRTYMDTHTHTRVTPFVLVSCYHCSKSLQT